MCRHTWYRPVAVEKIAAALVPTILEMLAAVVVPMVLVMLAAVVVQTWCRRFFGRTGLQCMHLGKLRAGVSRPARHTARYSEGLRGGFEG